MKIYTRSGDDGTTSLSGGRRVPKYHVRVEAYGSIDELIAWIGLLQSCKENSKRAVFLVYIQDQLMRCAAVLAAADDRKEEKKLLLPGECLELLEEEIDKMEKKLEKPESFILPGGNKVVSWCHIARTVCRRAEREVLKVTRTEQLPEVLIKFLNRLGDYLFVLSRKLSHELDIKETKWSV